MKKPLISILISAAVILSPPAALFRSLAVMLPYSHYHSSRSVATERDFDISIPGGLSTSCGDWYPFVMTFNDSDGFRKYTGMDHVSLTVMYNFPAFSPIHGCSRLFDPDSPYFGAFYGAYIIGGNDGNIYGFSDGKPDMDTAIEIPKYDLDRLVLEPFGLNRDEELFEAKIVSEESGVSYAGFDGWDRYDVKMTVNGPAHKYSEFDQSYLQYGIPTYGISEEFPETEMYGRIYARFFENSSTGIFFYILSKDITVLENCDRDILSKSTISGDI